MSVNNQMLVKEFEGKWYVFDVMAESWIDAGSKNETINYLSIKQALSSHDSMDEAYTVAHESITEYGISDHLIKDGADVTLTN